MSLRAQIQAAVQTGIASMGDLAEPAIYNSVGTPSYVTSTGVITPNMTPFVGIPVVFTRYKNIEIDGQAIRAQDQKAIIATLDMQPIPTINDQIVRADGTVWNIIGINVDPAGAAWVLQIRKP